MIRQIVRPTQNTYVLQLPDELVGKTVEVLAFEVEQDQILNQDLSRAQKLAAIKKGLDKFRVDLSSFKFNRDEANDYDYRIALDTNVLLYLHDSDQHSFKKNTAEELVASNPIVSTQVISEYLNVCHKRFKLTKLDALSALMEWLPFSGITNVSDSTYLNAVNLIKKYDFQLFDSIVIAAAIEANCAIFYSEDMHHNLLVENRLQIINPFLTV